MDEELHRFRIGGPTSAELERVKVRQEYSFLTGLERIGGFGGKADRLAMYNTYLGSPDLIGEDYRRYQSVTAEDVRGAADRVLGKPRLVLSFVPEKSARPSRPEPDRSQKPPLRESSHFQVPGVTTARLSNGVTLQTVTRTDVPKVVAGLLISTGADGEPPARAGLAWMVAEMLDEGTAARTALEIEAELDALGSDLSTSGNREWSHVTLQSLKRNLAPSLAVMADVVLRPSFPDEELERARKQRLDAILQERASAGATANRVARMLLFGREHPYGRPVSGTESSIRSLARGDLDEFYRASYAPSHATLVFVGDIEPQEALALSEEAFSAWKVDAPAPAPIQPVSARGRRLYAVDRPDSPQSEIRLAGLLPEKASPDRFAIEVLNTVLGGGFSSRLNLNLREEKGYTYGAFSALGHGRVQGLWLQYSPVHAVATGPALVEMLREIEDLAFWKRPVTDKELDDARATLVRGYAQRFETLSQVASELLGLAGYRLPAEELRLYTEGIEKVGMDDLRRTAEIYLRPGELTLLVVGDRRQFEAGLDELGPIEWVDVEGNPV